MEFWFYIIFIGILLGFLKFLIVDIWPLTLSVVAVWIFVHFRNKEIKRRELDEKQRQGAIAASRQAQLREEEARKHKEEENKKKQDEYLVCLTNLVDTSIAIFEMIPKKMSNAESNLDRALTDYEEGAFAPFWDSIERATMLLGQIDDDINKITDNSKLHIHYSSMYDGAPPPFPISGKSAKALMAANITGDRLNAIVRRAHRNFQFATIYEQRKTNQILVAGFTSLGQALEGMTRRITSSIDDLECKLSHARESLESSFRSVENTINVVGLEVSAQASSSARAIENSVGANVKALGDSMSKDAQERTRREKLVLERLDNIQRNKKPWP